jgi:hypothetical protein
VAGLKQLLLLLLLLAEKYYLLSEWTKWSFMEAGAFLLLAFGIIVYGKGIRLKFVIGNLKNTSMEESNIKNDISMIYDKYLGIRFYFLDFFLNKKE